MTEQERQQAVYARAMASIREKENMDQGFAAGLAYIAVSLSDEPRLVRYGDWAKTFCLLFFMALPPYFVWAYLLG